MRASELRAAARTAARQAGLSLEEWIEEAIGDRFDPEVARGRYRDAAEDRTATSLLNRRLDLIEDMLGDLATSRGDFDPEPDAHAATDPDEIVGALADIFNQRQSRQSSGSAKELAALLGEDLPVSRHAASGALRSISARLDSLAAKTPGVDARSDSDPVVRNIEKKLDELAKRIDKPEAELEKPREAYGPTDAVIDKHILRLEQKLDAMAERFHAPQESPAPAEDAVPAAARSVDMPLDTAVDQPPAEAPAARTPQAKAPLNDLNAAVDQIISRQKAIESGMAGIPAATASQTASQAASLVESQASKIEAEANAIRSEIQSLAQKIDTTNASGTHGIDARLQTLLEQIDTATRAELAEMRAELRDLSMATEQAIREGERRHQISEDRLESLSRKIDMPSQSINALESKVATLADLLARAPDAQAGMGADLAARIDALSDRISHTASAAVSADPQHMTALDQQLNTLGGDIAALRAQAVGRDLLNDVFDRIGGQMEAINQRLDHVSGAAVPTGVETLGDKIDQLHVQLAQMSSSGSMDGSAIVDIQHRIDELGHRLEQKAASGADASVLADIQLRIDDLAQRADAAAESVLDPQLFHALEGRMAEMADQVSAISQASGGGQTEMLQGLSRQIAHLAGQIENRGPETDSGEIKAALSELATRIDSARAHAVDAAREAAQEVIAQGSGDSGLVQALKSDLESLRAANSQANERTESSLGDMRNVLSSIVGRISELDGSQHGSNAENHAPQNARIEPQLAASAPSHGDMAPMDMSGDVMGPAGAQDDRGPDASVMVDGGNPVAALADAVSEDDGDLELADELIVRENKPRRDGSGNDGDREQIGNRLGDRINQMLEGKAPQPAVEDQNHSAPGFDPQDEPIVPGIDEDTPLSPGSREPATLGIAGLPDLDHMLGDESPDTAGSNGGSNGKTMGGQASASDFIAAARQAAAQARGDDSQGGKGGKRAKRGKADAPKPVTATASAGKSSPLGRMRKPLVLASAALLLVVGSLKVYEMLQDGGPAASMVDLDGAASIDDLDGAAEDLPQGLSPDGDASPEEQSSLTTPLESLSAVDDEAEASRPEASATQAATAEPAGEANRASRAVGTGFIPLPAPNVSAQSENPVQSVADTGTPDAAGPESPTEISLGTGTDGAGADGSGADGAPLTTNSVQPAGTTIAMTPVGNTYVPGGFAGNEEGSGIFNNTLPDAIGTAALRKAAQDGDPAAQFEVARRFSEGRAIPQDLEAAADWYQRAAAQGLAPAQYALATLYEKGNGLEQDVAMAEMWYKRAADQGNRKAMYNLAVMLSAGAKGTPDYAGAGPWFRRAAELGLRDSQFNLGVMHARGLGVAKDNIEAFKWFWVAAAQGDSEAQGFRDRISAEMSEEERARADEIARSWRPARLVQEANFVTVPAALTQGEVTRDPGLQQALDPEVVLRATQTLLNRLGYNAGPPDGLMGPRTRNAIRSFERSVGWPETGRATPRLLNRMKQAAN
jgi:localization factor PodJL